MVAFPKYPQTTGISVGEEDLGWLLQKKVQNVENTKDGITRVNNKKKNFLTI